MHWYSWEWYDRLEAPWYLVMFHQEKRRAAQRVAAKQLQQVTMVDVGDVLFEDVGLVAL